jgi:hypothetical protein
MEQELNRSKVYLEQKELDKLVTQIKETVAKDIVKETEHKQTFSAADLWNIRRMKKEYQRRPTLWN